MSTTIAPRRPSAASATGRSALASTRSSMVIAKSAAESSAQPAPAVAPARPAVAAASEAPPSDPSVVSFGTFSTDVIRSPATGSGNPTRANDGSGSFWTIKITATKPSLGDASGETTDRPPLTRPRSRQPRPAASHTPVTVAKASARHSAEPLGRPSLTSASGRKTMSPVPIDHVSAVHTSATPARARRGVSSNLTPIARHLPSHSRMAHSRKTLRGGGPNVIRAAPSPDERRLQ